MGELFSGIGTFLIYLFLNPLWYLSILVVYFLSAKRVKRERASFHTRVYRRLTDYTIPFLPSVITGLILSLVMIGLGVVITKEFIIVVSALYILTMLSFQIRWMSPAFVIGIVLLLYGCEPYLGHIEWLKPMYATFSVIPIYIVAGILALLVIAEGVLIRTNGTKYSSPSCERSNRGKWVGYHQVKRLWVVPIFFFIPEGWIGSFGQWPLFAVGDGGWQPVLLPFLFGFEQKIRTTLPHLAIRTMGLRITGLGLLFLLLAIGSFYAPFLAIIIGGVALVFREFLFFFAKVRERSERNFFTMQPTGCVVLGVLPNSPAEKMEIMIGETVLKVNGQAVRSEEQFYEALQLNAAYCKLEVLDLNGEMRITQGALYDGEHHQLGILLVKDDIELQDSIL